VKSQNGFRQRKKKEKKGKIRKIGER